MTGRLTILALMGVLIADGQAMGAGFGPGRAIYDRHCANCHGFDGVPNLPGTPDFTRGEGLQNNDPKLINAIRFGLRSMPGFDQTIDKEELIDVVLYIRTLQR